MLARLYNRVHWRGTGNDLTIDGRGSRVYDRFTWVLGGFYRRLAADAATAAPPGGAVLDVGTGPGPVLLELARQRPDLRITGIDLSADMVALAAGNIQRAGLADRADARQADVADLPFPDATFDLVVSSLSLHHWGAVAPAMAELARVLRPGGALWIYDMRSLPDGDLAAAAAASFGGQVPQRTLPRLARLPVRLMARWTISRPTVDAPAADASTVEAPAADRPAAGA